MSDDREATTDNMAPEPALDVVRRGLRTTPELVRGLWVTALIGIAFAIGQIAAPVVIQLAIDRGGLTTGDVDVDKVTRLVVFGVGVVAFAELLGLVAKRRMIRRAESSLRRLRVTAFDHIHRLSLADHDESATGVLISRVTSDVDALSVFAEWGMFVWIVQPIVIIGAFVAMAVYSWPLAVVALATFLPVFAALRWTRGRMGAAHDARRTAVGDLLGAFDEALAGAEVVRAYRAQGRTRRRLERASRRRYRAGLRANFYMSGVFVIGDLVGAIMLAAVLVVGVSQREALGLSAGELIAVLFLITLLHAPIGELGDTLNEAQQAIAGWRKVLNLLDRPIENLDGVEGLRLPHGALAIEATGVGFSYRGGAPVLSDISITIPAGARVAIVGETGSGKSTFAKLLCRLADPTTGAISLGGTPLTEVAVDARQAAVRLVPQDGFLFEATLRENISFGRPGATDADIAAAVAMLDLEPWVASLPAGLDTLAGERGGSISVGERQLVSFVRAAVANPGLLILDEATSSVDPRTDLELTRALDRLAEGRTVVSIAHRLSTAETADLVLVFDSGRLVEQGTHQDLVALGGVYAGLYEAWSAAMSRQ